MRELRNKIKITGEREQIKAVEIEYIEVKDAEFERRIVALIQVLLEIDGSGALAESPEVKTKEAA